MEGQSGKETPPAEPPLLLVCDGDEETAATPSPEQESGVQGRPSRVRAGSAGGETASKDEEPGQQHTPPASPAPTTAAQQLEDPRQPQQPHLIPDHQLHQYFEILDLLDRDWVRGPIHETRFRVRIIREIPGQEPLERQVNLDRILEAAFQNIIDRQNASPEARGQFRIEHDKLFKVVTSTKRKPLNDLSFKDAGESLGKVLNSDESVKLNSMVVTLSVFERISNIGGRSADSSVYRTSLVNRKGDINEFLRRKKCIVNPTASNRVPPFMKNMCLPLALVREMEVVLEKRQYGSVSKKTLLCFSKTQTCFKKAHKLVKDSGVIPAYGPYTIDDIAKFAQFLPPACELNIFADVGPPIKRYNVEGSTTAINLLVLYNYKDITSSLTSPSYHTYAINNNELAAFFGTKYFCRGCFRGHNYKRHKCSVATCELCCNGECKNLNNDRKKPRRRSECAICNNWFHTLDCYNAHFASPRTCKAYWRCEFCSLIILASDKERHKKSCGWYCFKCGGMHSPWSQCFVRPEKPKKMEKDGEQRPVFYADAECQIDPNGDHTCNLLILQRELAPNEEHPPPSRPPSAGSSISTLSAPGTPQSTSSSSSSSSARSEETLDAQELGQTVQEYIYRGSQAMDDFVRDCIAEKSVFANGLIVFHNFGKYDGHLMHKSLLRAHTSPKYMLRRAQQIITMKLRQHQIETRDSLLFVPVPLSKFGQMFGLDQEKGDFGHRLNTPTWVDFADMDRVYREVDADGTIHRFPKLEYFFPESKSTAALQRLQTWHAAQVELYRNNPNLHYRPARELVRYCRLSSLSLLAFCSSLWMRACAYCRQDVRVLRLGMRAFSDMIHQQFPKLRVFDSLTFSSLNNRIFRDYFMEKDSICLLPPQGFVRENARFSVIALAWVAWMEQELGLESVREARRGFEIRVGGKKVDGAGVDEFGNRHVLEFHGCATHGHGCIKPRTEDLDILDENSQKTDARLIWLASNPPDSPYGFFRYHVVYECELRKEMSQDHRLDTFIRTFIKQYNTQSRSPMNLRQALRGGRTNAILHRIQPVRQGYRFEYYDFTSLYPHVQHVGPFPIGIPDIYYGSLLDKAPPMDEWFGFVKARVLPPKSLLHPVLGHLSGSGRLVFALCSFCAEQCDQAPDQVCTHSDAERAYTGVYFTRELDLARSKGYKVLSVAELWNWPSSRRSDTMFKDMIRTAYRNKALASPTPSDPEALARLIREYQDTMGLELLPEEFQENPTLRAFAKLSLNNIWGFLGKRNDQENTEYVSSYADYLAIETHEKKQVTRVVISDDEQSLLVCWRPVNEAPSRTGSVAIAAIVTSYARIKLYQVIDTYQAFVAYFDTDSVMLYLPDSVASPATSNVLGGLKNELVESYGPSAVVTEYSSLGPKSYHLRVVNKETGELIDVLTKMKGIHYTNVVERELGGGRMSRLLEPGSSLLVPQHLIRKQLDQGRLFSSLLHKCIRFNSRKRRLLLNTSTLYSLPYGFDPIFYRGEEGEEEED